MDTFTKQVDALRETMLETHKGELRQLSGLDRALLDDDTALRDELRGIRQRHETRRRDIIGEMELFAASLGRLPRPRQAQELPTVDQALAQLERRPQIATIPGMNAGVPNVTAAAPHVPGADPRFAVAGYDEPMPRIVTNRARG
jgi:hypothetical protein